MEAHLPLRFLRHKTAAINNTGVVVQKGIRRLAFFAANFQLAKGGENMLNSTKAKGVAPALTHATTRDAESDYL